MKILTILLFILFIASNAYAIKMTPELWDNLGLVHLELQKKYPQFEGFNANRDNAHAVGLDDAIAEAEINAMDFQALRDKAPHIKRRKKLIQKLKDLGLDDEDLETLGVLLP